MKITSVIFLILSVVLIIGGIFACNYARGLAPNDEAIDGPQIEDGQIFDEIDYSDQNVSRIALNLENCTVTIHGGAKRSHVSLTNFEPNKYIGSVNNKTLTVSNNISFSDYLNLDGSGVSFAGVWRTLRSFYLANDTAEKAVDIYLADDEDIKQLALTVTNADVKILDVSQTCDITLNATGSTVELNSLNFSTMTFTCTETALSMLRIDAKAFNLEMNAGELTMMDFAAESVDYTVKDADINLNNANIENLVMKLNNVNMRLSTDYSLNNYNRSILLEDGQIILNGEAIGSSDTFELEGLLGSIQIEGVKSNVNMLFGETAITPPDTAPSTEPGTEPATEPETNS